MFKALINLIGNHPDTPVLRLFGEPLGKPFVNRLGQTQHICEYKGKVYLYFPDQEYAPMEVTEAWKRFLYSRAFDDEPFMPDFNGHLEDGHPSKR